MVNRYNTSDEVKHVFDDSFIGTEIMNNDDIIA